MKRKELNNPLTVLYSLSEKKFYSLLFLVNEKKKIVPLSFMMSNNYHMAMINLIVTLTIIITLFPSTKCWDLKPSAGQFEFFSNFAYLVPS